MRQIKFILTIVLLIYFSLNLSCRFYPPCPEADSGIMLYKDNNAKGRCLCLLKLPAKKDSGDQRSIYTLSFKETNSECTENDKASSLVLKNVPAGVRIYLYDDPGCNEKVDSTTLIVVKRYLERKVIGSFEKAFSDTDVNVIILKGGNLDGRVSCVGRAWW